MSFNRRGGPDRRPDRPDRDRSDRPPRRDWQPRDRGEGGGGERPYPPRDRPPGDRPYQQRGGGGGRPYSPRPRYDRPPDEGAMSIRLDPRRAGTLKQLAGDAGVRPGDLVRQWVEERIDAARGGAAVPTGEAGRDILARMEELATRVAALESAGGTAEPEPEAQPEADQAEPNEAAQQQPEAPKRRRRNAVSAAPGPRVALHDEMIAVLGERGPMTAAELAGAIAERGRYAPPRSGKPLDAAMVSQRVSNPTYRSRFVRSDGRIGLAE